MSAQSSRLEQSLTQLETLGDEIQSNLQRLDGLPLGDRNKLDTEIEKQISKFETILQQMTNDLRGVKQPTQKNYYDGEIKSNRVKHSKFVEELRSKRAAVHNDPRLRQEQQLMNNAQKGKKINDTLDEAIRVGQENIAMGAAGMDILHDDAKRIKNINNNISQINSGAEQGAHTVNQMSRRQCLQGFLSWIICILLFIILVASLIYKLTKKD